MSYIIKVHYLTGDSFRREETTEVLDYGWDSYEKAQENVRRIDEHAHMHKELCDTYHASFEELKENYGHKDWFFEASYKESDMKEFLAGNSLYLLDNNGFPFQFSTPWIGFFETYYGAMIQIDTP